MASKLKVVAFDADDTLWHNERFFKLTQARFAELLGDHADPDHLDQRLLEAERRNIGRYGFGIKGFTLSMIETAVEVSDGRVGAEAVQQIIDWGKDMMAHPVELLAGVAETIEELRRSHRLVLITKGDLFHQETKIAESGLAPHFEAIEILSEKSPEQYRKVLGRAGIDPSGFAMVGNSLRSDVQPVIDIGGHGIHIPYGILWGHERVEAEPNGPTFHRLDCFADLPGLLSQLD